MKATVNLDFPIASVWERIRTLRETIDLAMERFDKDVREAARMTATELVENAIRHSAPCETGIRFNLKTIENRIVITVINKVASEEDIRIFEQHVKQLNGSDDPKQLYVKRLAELGDNPGESRTRLGLYRIAYEGEYNIKHKLENGFLTVVASVKNKSV